MKTKILLIIAVLYIFTSACSKEDATGTDKQLYDMALVTNGFTWYKNSESYLPKSQGSGHNQAFLRTRYNDLAATQLDSNGKVNPDAVFPNGSLIVKELYNSDKTLDQYAILYKQSNHIDADANGWVWGYVSASGKVAEPAEKKGQACTSCHLQTGHIDYLLMNKYFP
ncbi:MAG: cytochrome P460 family protein [Bacteroidales bacterium]|nr:cytochrome P460 family protein [Bacteroidales bacterium]